MVCPHCQQALPENYTASYCPHCGGAVPPPVSTYVEKRLEPVKISWFIIFGALLAPPLLTLLTALLCRGRSNEGVSPTVGLLGGGAGGIAFGIMLALRLGKTTSARVGMAIVFSVIFMVVCIMLSCFGCLVGGYQMRLE